MAKKPTARVELVMVNVTYEDGSQRSNRKVSADLFSSLDPTTAVRQAIEEQDKVISERSGMPPLAIKSITRVR
jgi:hypothetical protein